MKVWLVTLMNKGDERNLHAVFAKKEDAMAEMKENREWLANRCSDRVVVLEEVEGDHAPLVIAVYDDSGTDRIERAAMVEIEVQ